MLGIRWVASHPGAPDNPAYNTAVDELHDMDGNALQTLRKVDAGCPEPQGAFKACIDGWLARRGKGRAVVMVHGFAFDPRDGYVPGDGDDPFNRVYANPKVERYPLESWLPIVGETYDDGRERSDIAIGFCWTSTGSMWEYGKACWSNPYQYAVLDLAPQAAKALALVIRALVDAGVEVDVLAHSLGTRATLQAIKLLKQANYAAAVRQALLLGGAEFSVDARDAVAGTTTDVFSFATRGDEVLALGASKMLHPFRMVQTEESRVIGRDGMGRTAHWIDFQLDRPDAAAFNQWFQAHYGCTLSGQAIGGRGQHWAYYMQPGNRTLFRALLENDTTTPPALRAMDAPDGIVNANYDTPRNPVPATPMTCQERLNPVAAEGALIA